MNSDARDRFVSEFAVAADALAGARLPWLRSARRTALERFAYLGLPTRRHEDWKYTSLAEFERHAFRSIVAPEPSAEATALVRLHAPKVGEAYVMVFCDGRHIPSLSRLPRVDGVRLASLAETLEREPENVESYFGDGKADAAFASLNTAFMSDGAFLRLARDAVLDRPLHLLFISSHSGAANHMRNLIVAEAGARATVVEHYVGAGQADYFTNAITQIATGENAQITHHKLQQEGAQAFHIAGIHAVQQRDSRIASHSVTLGGLLTRNDITTDFRAPGCEATFEGLYLLADGQHVDNHTRVDHAAPHGTSREHYRGVLDGRSRGVFNGKVVVHPGAQKTNAFQENHNLLLSLDAEIDTKPELEIYADDVKCNHGATIGQLDERQLFYLRSRGIDPLAARAMLIRAFVHSLIDRIRDTSLRARLDAALLARLPMADQVGKLSGELR